MGNGNACCHTEAGLVSSARGHIDECWGVGTSEALLSLVEPLSVIQAKLGLSCAHPLLMNLGLLMKQATEDRRYRRPPTSDTPFEDAKVLQRAGRYLRYASAAAHLEDGRRTIAEIVGGGMLVDNVKHVHFDDMFMDLGYFIAVDPETEDIVLCIRGDEDVGSALQKALLPKEPWMGGRVHAALLRGARSIMESVTQVLLRLSQEMPRRGIALVGHSAGGGIAALLSILLCSEGCPFAKLMAAGKVKCYCFGSPPTFEPTWALPAWVHGSTYSFVYNMDCVPRACMGTLSKLYAALHKIDQLPLSVERRLAYMRGESSIETELQDSVDIPEGTGNMFASLLVVGTPITLYRAQAGSGHCEGVVQCEHTPAHLLDRMVVHPEFMHNHSITCFEEVFEDLRLQLDSRDGCVLS